MAPSATASLPCRSTAMAAISAHLPVVITRYGGVGGRARSGDEVLLGQLRRARGGRLAGRPLLGAPLHLDGEVGAVQLAQQARGALLGARHDGVALFVDVEHPLGAERDADPTGFAEAQVKFDLLRQRFATRRGLFDAVRAAHEAPSTLSLIHISEPTRQAEIS